MKTLLTLLLVIPLFSWGQEVGDFYYDSTENITRLPLGVYVYKDGELPAWAKPIERPKHKWYGLSKNDVWIIGIQVAAGYAQGFREEVLQHHYELSKRFPGLFKNGKTFWDGRNFDDGIWDADHMLKGTIIMLETVCIIIKIGDLKNFKGWCKVGKIAMDSLKFYGSYHLGFFLAYNVTNQNPLFK